MKKVIFFVGVVFFLICPYPVFAAEDFFGRGIAEYRAENYEEALGLFLKAREKQPKSSVAAFYLGLTYKQLGQYRESATNLKDALTLTPPVLDAYTELIEMLYNLNELKEAKEWISKADKDKVRPAHITFLKGLVLSKEDKNKEAIEAFKNAKELDKTLTQASDFQIAMAHARDRRYERAKESLKAVITVDPASDLANFAKEYEKAIVGTLKEYKPWRFSAGITYQYDDNVVSKPSSGIAGVEITGERDIGIVTSFGINYTPILPVPWLLNAQYSASATSYRKNMTHDTFSQTVSLIPGYDLKFNGTVIKGGAVTLPLSYTHMWLRKHRYMEIISAKPALSMVVFSRQHIIQLSPGYTKRGMIQAPINSDEDRDGDVLSIGIGYIYTFLEGKGMFNLRYEHSNDNTDGTNWDNTGNRISIGTLLPVGTLLRVPAIEKLNLSMSGDMYLQRYRNIHTVFDIKREEKTYTGLVSLSYEVIKDLNLALSYMHTRADSNIAVYDYRRNVYSAGIEFRF